MLAAAAMMAGTPAVKAAEYPERPITIVIPYTAGTGDTIMRLL